MTFKKEFWALLSIFLLPIGLGTLFFYLNPGYFSQNTVNYGELISPVIVTEKSDIEHYGRCIAGRDLDVCSMLQIVVMPFVTRRLKT